MRLCMSFPSRLLSEWSQLRNTYIKKSFSAEDDNGEKMHLSISFCGDKAVLVLEDYFKTLPDAQMSIAISNLSIENQSVSYLNESDVSTTHSLSAEKLHVAEAITNQHHPKTNDLNMEIIDINSVSNISYEAVPEYGNVIEEENYPSDLQEGVVYAVNNQGTEPEYYMQSFQQPPYQEFGANPHEMHDVQQPIEVNAQEQTKEVTERYLCSICGVSYKKKLYLRNHINSKHKGNKTASGEAELKSLAKKDTTKEKKSSKLSTTGAGRVVVKCEFCQQEVGRYALKEHKLTCRQNPDHVRFYYCTCGFKSIDSFITEEHKANCARRGSSKTCDICGKQYGSRGSLSQHRRSVHQAVVYKARPLVMYKCETCGKEFNVKSRLKRHEIFHQNVKTFTCDICGESFKRSYSLRVHNNTKHNNVFRYRCEQCGHGMQKKQELLKHQCGRVRRKQTAKKPAKKSKKEKFQADMSTTNSLNGGQRRDIAKQPLKSIPGHSNSTDFIDQHISVIKSDNETACIKIKTGEERFVEIPVDSTLAGSVQILKIPALKNFKSYKTIVLSTNFSASKSIGTTEKCSTSRDEVSNENPT